MGHGSGRRGLAWPGAADPCSRRTTTSDSESPVDFVLAFWMAHETEDTPRFFKQVISILKEQGKMLIAEPKMHGVRRRFHEIVQAACDAGFQYSGAPAVRLSRAALLERN